MSIPLDATDFENEDDAQYTSGDLLAAGTFHCVVEYVDDKFDTHEQIIFNFQALAGTTPGQEGRMRKLFLDFRKDPDAKTDPNWKADRARAQLTQLWMSLKLLAPKSKGTCDPALAVGRECIVLFVEGSINPKTGRPWVNFESSYALDNPEVADVPRGAVAEQTEQPDAVGADVEVGATTGSDFDDL